MQEEFMYETCANACSEILSVLYESLPCMQLNFVSNSIFHVWKYVQCQLTNKNIPSSLKNKIAFATDNLLKSWVLPPRDWTGHGIA